MPLPPKNQPQAERILNSSVKKKTRHDQYIGHLIKWEHLLEEKATWVFRSKFENLGIDITLLSPVVT